MMATQATKDRASQEGVNAWRTVDLGSYNPVHSPPSPGPGCSPRRPSPTAQGLDCDLTQSRLDTSQSL